MLYRHVFDKISTEFLGIFRVFVNFAAAQLREISEALHKSSINPPEKMRGRRSNFSPEKGKGGN